ncbi:MAG: leucyl aminopeptidase [Candidatus Woesearchaeota archaeon]
MKLTVNECMLKNLNADVLVIPVFKDIENEEEIFVEMNNLLNKLLSQTIYENKDIKEDGKFHLFYTNSRVKLKRILLVGLGRSDEIDAEKIRNLGGKLAGYCKSNSMKNVAFLGFGYSLKNIAIDDVSKALIEGILLGNYSYEEFKTLDNDGKSRNSERKSSKDSKSKGIESFLIIPQVKSDKKLIDDVIKETEIICRNVNIVRDLVNKPANIINPTLYAKEIKKLFTKTKVSVKVLEEPQIKKEKMNCILGVAKGSVEKPKLVILNYTPPRAKKTIALVGKGVTFDSGGINIKPSAYLTGMKGDMGGSAAVIGAIRSAAELRLPIKIIGIMPLVENMPSGNALKTGDVLIASNGKSIEVENTDAEGRLILADALHYATKFKPDYIVDIATLTGAAAIALGTRCSSLMGNEQDLVDALLKAGKETHDLAWQLPLLKEYEDDIKGSITDIKNLGAAQGEAGTIIGGIFLRHFIGKNDKSRTYFENKEDNEYKWAHIDIGATSSTSATRPYLEKGATGAPVRLLVKWLMGL